MSDYRVSLGNIPHMLRFAAHRFKQESGAGMTTKDFRDAAKLLDRHLKEADRLGEEARKIK